MEKYFLLGITFLTLVVIFWQRFIETSKDAEVGPATLTGAEWLKHTAVEMAFDLALFVALCAGINLDFILKATEAGTDTGSQATLVSIGGAIATGTAIYKGVQIFILPLFNRLTGGTTARKKLRTKVEAEVKAEAKVD